ncbi:hypothetical protein [Streptomyces sp. NPDC059819]|uniref:hypothetical protein n=1 Tax=Streptomyces sp. NPDC059819 TaxID=3346963 RepID=UPI003655B083
MLRPAILFGGHGVLLNNIACLLRHLPVFAVGAHGKYRIRGSHVDDLAHLRVTASRTEGSQVLDAVGPERPTFLELVEQIRAEIGSSCRIVHVPGRLVPPPSVVLGLALRDRLLITQEYQAMANGLADTDCPPTGTTALSHWLTEHADHLGLHYANEIKRHFR